MHVLDHPAAQLLWRSQVHFATEDLRQFLLSRHDAPSRRASRLELHQHVHITPRRIQVLPHHRPEERQLADAPLAAELGDLLVGNGGWPAGGRRACASFYWAGLILPASAVMV